MTPGTEGALANYFFNGTTMRPSDDGSRTPMAILSDLESTGEGFDLWDELTTTVTAKKRHQMRTSNHIDSVCPSGPATILINREITQLILVRVRITASALSIPALHPSRPCRGTPGRRTRHQV